MNMKQYNTQQSTQNYKSPGRQKLENFLDIFKQNSSAKKSETRPSDSEEITLPEISHGSVNHSNVPRTLQARSPKNGSMRSPGRNNNGVTLQNMNAHSPGQHSKLGLKSVLHKDNYNSQQTTFSLKKTSINTNV